MKNILSFFMVVLMLFTILMVGASAKSMSYNIPQLGLSLNIPEEFDVFSADLSVYEAENAFSVSDEELKQYFEENNIFLEALSPDRNMDVTVTGALQQTGGNIYSYSELDDSELRAEADEIYQILFGAGDSVPGGVTSSPAEIVMFSDTAVFIVFEYTAGEIAGIKYYTVWEGISVTMSVYMYDGDISLYRRSIADEIASSFVFESSRESAPLIMGRSFLAGILVSGFVLFCACAGLAIVSATEGRRSRARVYGGRVY